MQLVQRCVLVIIVMLVVVYGTYINVGKQEELWMEQWEELQTERFLNKIAEEGNCTYEEFMMYYEALNYDGVSTEIRLEEYQEEEDNFGRDYWFLISWTEIQEVLIREGEYCFQKGSALELSVRRITRVGTSEHTYCDIVS